MLTFPHWNDSRVSLCIFRASSSPEELLPVDHETVRCDKSVFFFKNLSITLAVIILSTNMMHETSLAFLQQKV